MENPSAQQLAVKNTLLNTLLHIFLSATAGSGKTTTIVWLLSFLRDKSVLCCAFNRDIKEELEERCKQYSNVKVATLHAIGYGMLKKEYGCGSPDASKYRKIFVNMSTRWKLPDDKEFGSRVMQLVDLFRLCLVKTRSDANEIATLYNISTEHNEVDIALQVIEAGRCVTKTIDFTDMIYLPVYYRLKPSTRYAVVCVDEVQDLNKCQLEFILGFVAPGGRTIMVGDRWQSIYNFMGSDARSFDTIKTRPNTMVHPLSVTYRCPKLVVKYIRQLGINDEIEASPTAQDGVINHSARLTDIKDGDMVISRENLPLAKLCMQFLEKGVKAYIRGRDMGESLINLIKKTNKASMIDVIKFLNEDLSKLEKRLLKKHRGLTQDDVRSMPEYQYMKDKISTLKAITHDCKSVGDAQIKISKIFDDDKSKQGIMLSTVHKAKGLEARNVYIACDWRMPSQYAKTDIEKEQENNIRFVAYSRSLWSLNFLPKSEFDPYKKRSDGSNDEDDD